MKTLLPQDKKHVLELAKHNHYLCPYCGKYLIPSAIKNLQCDRCKTYLVWDEKENRPRLPVFKNE